MAKKKAKKAKKAKKPKKPSAKFLKPAAAFVATATIGAFAIMLDRLLSVHPNHFPITAQAGSLEDLLLVGQHNGSYGLIPRTSCRAELRTNKDLVNTETGQVDQGAIYELLPN